MSFAPDAKTDCPPLGFTPLANRVELEHYAGPFYESATDGRWKIGFRVKARHLNRLGDCHGGILATFADLQGHVLKKKLGLVTKSPTISVTLDYVAPVKQDEWVEAEPELVRQTPRMLFFRSLVLANEQVVMRTSGIYRLRLG
jgi:uncharacterized protein (TIGR00369 family)